MQTLAVFAIVGLCAVYAAWVLMPARLRRPLALRLLAWPLLARNPALQRAAAAHAGCGCGGCDANPGAPAATQTVHIVRRR